MVSSRKKAPKKRGKRKPPGMTGGKARMPMFVPTAEQRKLVEGLGGFGMRYDQISTLVINERTGKAISGMTLQKHFQTELTAGKAKADAKVAMSLHKKACSDSHPGAVTACIWWTKARMGWKGDHVTHDVQGATGVLVAPAKMTPEEWIASQEKANKGKKSPVED